MIPPARGASGRGCSGSSPPSAPRRKVEAGRPAPARRCSASTNVAPGRAIRPRCPTSPWPTWRPHSVRSEHSAERLSIPGRGGPSVETPRGARSASLSRASADRDCLVGLNAVVARLAGEGDRVLPRAHRPASAERQPCESGGAGCVYHPVLRERGLGRARPEPGDAGDELGGALLLGDGVLLAVELGGLGDRPASDKLDLAGLALMS